MSLCVSRFLFPVDTYDNHLFHIMIQNNLIYLAMTTNEFDRRLAFAFLEKIRCDYAAQLFELESEMMQTGRNSNLPMLLRWQLPLLTK